jgi:hypothetical protein
MQAHINGTFILKHKGRFYKVLKVEHNVGSRFAFECKDIETKQSQVLQFEMSGLLEALDSAASVMKDSKDILLMDLDNQGKWKIMTKDQIDKATKRH